MRWAFSTLAIVCILTSVSWSQPLLRTSIGVNSLPKDGDQICPIVPVQTGYFDNAGPAIGSVVNDFTLYDREGNPLTLSKQLAKGKPILLMSGSYTCTYFRSHIPYINSLYQRYADKLNMYIIYNIEAHPIIDEPPYLDEPIADEENLSEGIQYRQPTTYGERKAVAADMIKSRTIYPPLLFDGPCNEWNMSYGPAPNIAFLIDTNGIVKAKQGWLDLGSDISFDIDNLLNGTGSSPIRDTGLFSVRLLSSDTVKGLPGTTIAVSAEIINETDADAIVTINRTKALLPSGWTTSLCADVCFISSVDSTSVRVLAHSTQEVKVYFYSSKSMGQGTVSLSFINKNIPDNTITKDFHALTTTNLGVTPNSNDQSASISIYPSPVKGELRLNTGLQYSKLRINDGLGRMIRQEDYSSSYDVSSLSGGIYFVQLLDPEGAVLGSARFIKQ